MYQQIGELIGNIIPFGIFLYFTLMVFGIIEPKKKPRILENPSLLIKTVLVLGTIIFAVMIILSLLK